jgi:hypothetical protein
MATEYRSTPLYPKEISLPVHRAQTGMGALSADTAYSGATCTLAELSACFPSVRRALPCYRWSLLQTPPGSRPRQIHRSTLPRVDTGPEAEFTSSCPTPGLWPANKPPNALRSQLVVGFVRHRRNQCPLAVNLAGSLPRDAYLANLRSVAPGIENRYSKPLRAESQHNLSIKAHNPSLPSGQPSPDHLHTTVPAAHPHKPTTIRLLQPKGHQRPEAPREAAAV